MITHTLKTVEPYFTAVRERQKNFELRVDDRGFRVGDIVRLMQFVGGSLTGEYEDRIITYILRGYAGLSFGWCVLSLGEIEVTS